MHKLVPSLAIAALLGGVCTSPVSAQGCGSLAFTSASRAVAPIHGVQGLSDYTIEAWVRTNASTYQNVVGQEPATAGALGGFFFGFLQSPTLGARVLATQFLDATFSFVQSSALTFADGWHHAAVTRSNGFTSILFDGVVVGAANSQTSALGSTGGAITLGHWAFLDVFGPHHPDNLAEVRIFNIGRSPTQIAQTMFQRLPANTPGLIDYWPMDDRLGQIAASLTDPTHAVFLGSLPTPDAADPTWSLDSPPVVSPCGNGSAESDLRIPPSTLAVSPPSPGLLQAATISVTVQNIGDRASSGRVDFYLGDPLLPGAVPIGTSTVGTTPGQTVVTSVPWSPTVLGEQSVHVLVTNLTPPEQSPADNQAALLVVVGAPPADLQVDAGETTGWPGYTASLPGTLRNRGSLPLTLSGFRSGSPAWLTLSTPIAGLVLQPGATMPVLFDLQVPTTATGSLPGQPPVPQSLPFAIDATQGTASSSFAGRATVRLYGQPVATPTIRVIDNRTGAPLAGALVTARNLATVLTADAAGQVLLPIAPGIVDVFAYQPGYVAASATFAIPPGISTSDLRLEPGATMGLTGVDVRPLTTSEILSRGVSPSDPANNHIVDFVLHLAVGNTLVLYNQEVPRTDLPPPLPGTVIHVQGVAYPSSGSDGPGSGGPPSGPQPNSITYPSGSVVSGVIEYHPPPPSQPGMVVQTQTWIVIPGTVTFLREFFDVEVCVINNTIAAQPTDIELRNVSSSLGNLPPGLGLPDLFGQPQSLVQTATNPIGAGQSHTFRWVIRGDAAGDYTLSDATQGQLFGFGNFIANVVGNAQSPPFSVSQPRARLEFETPPTVTAGVPFTLGVRVVNEGTRPMQLVRVALDGEHMIQAEIDPVQPPGVTLQVQGAQVTRAEMILGDIAAQSSALAQFSLIPTVDGAVRSRSVTISSGDADLPEVRVCEFARVTAYGSGCPTSAGAPPTLTTNGAVPLLGSRLGLTIGSPATPNRIAMLLLGYSDQLFPGVGALPLPLDGYGMPGCVLLTESSFANFFSLDAAGIGTIELAVPDNVDLCGLDGYLQAFVFDSAANAAGAAASAGLHCVVGV